MLFDKYGLVTALELIAAYSKAIELDHEDAVNYYIRGNAYLNLIFYSNLHYDRNESRALTDFNIAIKLNPRYDDAYVSKGYIYNLRGEFSNAIENSEKALELNPDNALAKRLRIPYTNTRQFANLYYYRLNNM